jgi:hypothetical protein
VLGSLPRRDHGFPQDLIFPTVIFCLARVGDVPVFLYEPNSYMSAFGPKRTSLTAPHMSAFGGKADIRGPSSADQNDH